MAPLAAWSAGLLLQLRQASLWPSTDYLLLGALGLLLMGLGTALRRTTRLGGAGTVALLAGLLVLGLACAGGRALSRQAGLLDPALDNQVLWLEGTVDTLPQSGPEGAWLLVEVARGGRTPEPSASSDLRLPERVRLFWPLAPRDLAAGERWRWQARLRLPHGLSNPHGFDRELWLWEQGVGATGVVRTGPQAPAPQRLESPGWRPVERLRGQLAAAVRERVADPRVAGVVAALLVGEQSAIERADWRVFRDTGVAHLMRIKGSAKHKLF
jgi:competence protein ComEC